MRYYLGDDTQDPSKILIGTPKIHDPDHTCEPTRVTLFIHPEIVIAAGQPDKLLQAVEKLVGDEDIVTGVINWSGLITKMTGKDFKEEFGKLIRESNGLGIPQFYTPVNMGE